MPLPIMLAHRITKRLSEVRKAEVLPYLRPDGKAQVSVRYDVDSDGRQTPVEIERVLISTQHREGLDPEAMIKPDLIEHVLRQMLAKDLYGESGLGDPEFV
jgi:S-adenosylmethionine synthetase